VIAQSCGAAIQRPGDDAIDIGGDKVSRYSYMLPPRLLRYCAVQAFLNDAEELKVP
jgi:hypothetical protein